MLWLGRSVIFALLLLLPVVSFAQQVGSPVTFHYAGTVANLPTPSNGNKEFWIVFDGNSASDCTTGGGNYAVVCLSNGAVWAVATGGGGGGNQSGSTSASHLTYATGTNTLGNVAGSSVSGSNVTFGGSVTVGGSGLTFPDTTTQATAAIPGGVVQSCSGTTPGVQYLCTVTLTADQLNHLNSAPVTLIADPPSGYALSPAGDGFADYKFGTVAFTDGINNAGVTVVENTFDFRSTQVVLQDIGDSNQFGVLLGKTASSVWGFPLSLNGGAANPFTQPQPVARTAVNGIGWLLFATDATDWITQGAINGNSLDANPTVGYVNGDTGTITDPLSGNTSATYVITNAIAGVVQAGGYSLTSNGTCCYTVATGDTTTATSGIGTGLEIDVTSITPGDGTLKLTIPYSVVQLQP